MSSDSPDLAGYAATDGLTYNPNEAKFWDEDALEKEIVRSFELCHSCRLCFRYCRSFPTLFAAVDEADDVRKISKTTRERIVDECFQCKLCYTQCPYTEAEGHEFKLDFPRLLMRIKAVERRKSGIPLRDKMLADPDALGKVACKMPRLSNWANHFAPHRLMMEKLGGIHRRKLLPSFEAPTFESWFRTHSQGAANDQDDDQCDVVLFATCFVNYNRPSIGKAAVEVLAKNSCRVHCPEVNCCGMPALDQGDIETAKKKAATNVHALLPYVERGMVIAVINPTCSMMMKKEYSALLDIPAEPALAAAAEKVAAATMDISEFLVDLRKQGVFKEDFKSTPDGVVAYHAPCHLRTQNIGFRGRDLMRRIPGLRPRLVAECCGHNGTWAMKTRFFENAMKNGQKAFDGMQGADAALWTTDCPLAAIQFEQACGKKALHPIEVLARAYREDGFDRKTGDL